MVLHELHVLERRTGAIRERHPVAGLDRGIGREREHLPAPAGAEDHRARRDRLDAARHDVERDDTLHAPIVHEEPGDEPFVVADDAGVLERGLEEGVEHVEAGLVGGKPRALLLHAAERPHGNAAVGLAAPRAAPVLEPQQLLRRFLDERFDGVLVAQPVAAGNGVVDVLVEAVVGTDRAGGTALGGDGMAPHRVYLGNHRNPEAGIMLCDCDCRPEARTAAAYQYDVVRRVHVESPSPCSLDRTGGAGIYRLRPIATPR